MKRLGFKDSAAEVKGTPLEAIARLNIPEANDLDYRVLMKLSEVKLTHLHRLSRQTHVRDGKGGVGGVGIGWIDPQEFPNQFKEFAGKNWNRETDSHYRHVGEQIFLASLVIERAYQKTLGSHPKSPYRDLSYEQALSARTKPIKEGQYQHDPLSQSNVRHLTGVMMLYAPFSFEKFFGEPEAVKNASTRFNQVFKGKSMGSHVDIYAEGEGDKQRLTGKMRGLPVVILPYPDSLEKGKGKYYIFPKEVYDKFKGAPNRLTDALGPPIPFERVNSGDDNAIGEDVKDALTRYIRKKLIPISSSGGKYTKPTWTGSKWECSVKIDGSKRYGRKARPNAKAVIGFNPNGTLNIKLDGSPVALNLDYYGQGHNLFAGPLLMDVVNEDDMKMLIPFYNSGALLFVDDGELRTPPGAGGQVDMTVRIKGISGNFKITMDRSAAVGSQFSIKKADQEKLLKNP